MRIHRKSGKRDGRRGASLNDWNANNGREKPPRSTGSRHDGGRTPRLRKPKGKRSVGPWSQTVERVIHIEWRLLIEGW